MLHPPSICGLTCFRLKLDAADTEEMALILRIGPLAKLLQSLIALEELSFEFIAVEGITGAELFPIELPTLKSLSYASTVSSINNVQPIFSMIFAPTMEQLHLDIETMDCEEAESMLNAIFPDGVLKWPSLKSLGCRVVPYDKFDLPFTPYNGMFSRLSRLQHLHITAYTFLPPTIIALDPSVVEHGGNLYPPLRSLSLSNCKEFDIDFISALLPILESPEFERLEIGYFLRRSCA